MFGVKPYTVVVDLEEEEVPSSFQTGFDAGGVSVANNIGERFLKNAENGRGSLRIQGQGFSKQCDVTGDSGTALKLLRLPFQGGVQAQIVQRSGPKVGGNSSQGANHFVHQTNRGVNFGVQLSLSFCQLVANQGDIPLDRRAGLAELIVDLSCDRDALFFPNALNTCRKRAKLLERGLELFLGACALGYFRSQLLVDLSEDGGSLTDAKLQQLFGLFERLLLPMPLRHVPSDLGEPLQTSHGVPQGGDNDVSPETRAVFADSPSLVLTLSAARGLR